MQKDSSTARLAYFNLTFSNADQSAHSILRKIDQHAKVAREQGLPFDFYWLPRSAPPENVHYPHLKVLPVGGGNRFSTRFRQCLKMNEIMRDYHRGILRNPLFDPVGFLCLKQAGKMILEHHTKEPEELAVIAGKLRYRMEKAFGGCWIRKFRAVIAVTPEILEYEIKRSGFSGPGDYSPNSIDMDSFAGCVRQLTGDSQKPFQIIMVSTYFTPWQGLQEILDQIESTSDLPPFKLHVVGKLTPELEAQCRKVPQVVLHGTLSPEQIQELYPEMDLGVGSLTLAKKGLAQATPLKVREYLACGLPIVLGYDDPGLPADFPFALNVSDKIEFPKFLEFAGRHRQVPAQKIREAARPYIDSKIITQNFFDFCINT